MIVILDYEMGNVGSIQNMLKKIGERNAVISREPSAVANADKLILPGVGSYDMGMAKLEQYGLVNLIYAHVGSGKALLGICLGMQLLGRKSEEGQLAGLGLIPFECKRFDFSGFGAATEHGTLKVPHMGWDRVRVVRDRPLVEGLDDRQRYYFVHSYHAVCDSSESVLMACDYGYEFPAAVSSLNVYGVQFHPEKSHAFGMKVLDNFVRRC